MNILVVQTVVPSYRRSFFEALADQCDACGHQLWVAAGDEYFDATVRTPAGCEAIDLKLRNRYLGRFLLVQTGFGSLVHAADVVVLEYNPRILSSWFILCRRRLRGRRTLVWGHAWPRRGKKSRTSWLRHSLLRLASGAIAYTRIEASELAASRPRMSVFAAPNALYRSGEMVAQPGRGEGFVYVGRLISAKKVDLLLRAYAVMIRAHSDAGLLYVVGDGPEEQSLRGMRGRLGLEDSVRFLGHIDDVEGLAQIYAKCVAAVCPGYVGLAAVQAAGFGRPLIFGHNEPHAPELSLLDATNSVAFVSDSVMALANTMSAVLVDATKWREMGEAIAERARNEFSVEAMATGFIAALHYPNACE